MKKSLAFLLISACSSLAAAREFSLKDAGVGTYIRGEYGLPQRGDASFADSSGAGVSFDVSRSSNAGGEFGVLFASERFIFRVSAEVLLPKSLTGVNGSSGGTNVYALDSKVTAFLPQANIDLFLKKWPESRLFLSAGGGVAVVTTSNAYKFTAAGNTQYPTLSDHTETGKGQSFFIQSSLGYEFVFADRATLTADLGYRYCKIATLTASDPVTTFSGNYAAGDTLKTNDGSNRSLDLGGVFAGVGFRFYF